MKKLILIILLSIPLLTFAEYSGVHVEFEIQLLNGNKVHGYKYLAHGINTDELKVIIEQNPSFFLKNQHVFEEGEYGYYSKRLEYSFQDSRVFRLIEPKEIILSEIKVFVVKEMITASYDIQIVGDYTWEDRFWLDSKPLIKYSVDDEMCTYKFFIHKKGNIPNGVIEKLNSIIQSIDNKIQVQQAEYEEDTNIDHVDNIKSLIEERKRLLESLFKEYKNLKKVIISMCSC